MTTTDNWWGQLSVLGWLSICRWARSQPMREDVTNVMSSLIGLELAHPWVSPGQWSYYLQISFYDISFHIFSCDQAALRTPLSVRPSVCLSVTPFSPCSCHRIATKFSGVITNAKSDVHAKGQGHRSKVKVTEVITQLSRFRTVTPVGIHIWWQNDAQSLMVLRRSALLFFKVIHQISRSHGSKKRRFWPKLGVSGL